MFLLGSSDEGDVIISRNIQQSTLSFQSVHYHNWNLNITLVSGSSGNSEINSNSTRFDPGEDR